MTTARIEHNLGEDDVPATLVFHYWPDERQTLETPEVVGGAELECVIVGGVDILCLLEDSYICSLVTDFEAGAIG